ncbi:hypothetical protein ACFTAO_25685 [Paenibacillus rhizoplanae]
MILDPFTRRNLELTETVRERSKKRLAPLAARPHRDLDGGPSAAPPD